VHTAPLSTDLAVHPMDFHVQWQLSGRRHTVTVLEGATFEDVLEAAVEKLVPTSMPTGIGNYNLVIHGTVINDYTPRVDSITALSTVTAPWIVAPVDDDMSSLPAGLSKLPAESAAKDWTEVLHAWLPSFPFQHHHLRLVRLLVRHARATGHLSHVRQEMDCRKSGKRPTTTYV
jgi:hypothetical protein